MGSTSYFLPGGNGHDGEEPRMACRRGDQLLGAGLDGRAEGRRSRPAGEQGPMGVQGRRMRGIDWRISTPQWERKGDEVLEQAGRGGLGVCWSAARLPCSCKLKDRVYCPQAGEEIAPPATQHASA